MSYPAPRILVCALGAVITSISVRWLELEEISPTRA
jgi:hypothetical protein